VQNIIQRSANFTEGILKSREDVNVGCKDKLKLNKVENWVENFRYFQHQQVRKIHIHDKRSKSKNLKLKMIFYFIKFKI
jgi:hypothetical protein